MRSILRKMIGLDDDAPRPDHHDPDRHDAPRKGPWDVSARSSEDILRDHAALLQGEDPAPRGPRRTTQENDEVVQQMRRPEHRAVDAAFRWATRHQDRRDARSGFGPAWNPRLTRDIEAVIDAAYNPEHSVASAADVRPGDEFFILVPDRVNAKELVGLADFARGNLEEDQPERLTSQGARARVLEVNGEEAVCLYLDDVLTSGFVMPHGAVYRTSAEFLALNPRLVKGPGPAEPDPSYA